MNGNPTLAPAERDKIAVACHDLLEQKPWDKAWPVCKAHLDQHPEDLKLKLMVGSMLPMISTRMEDKAQAREVQDIAIDLCGQAANSGDPALRQEGNRMLTALYMITDQLDLAEAAVRGEKGGPDAMDLRLASILLRKGQLAEAELMFQRCLFDLVNDFEMALAGMASVSHALGNTEREILYWESIPALNKMLGTDRIAGMENARLALAHAYAGQGNLDKALDYLEAFTDGVLAWSEELDFSGNPYFNRLTGGGQVVVVSSHDQSLIANELKRFRAYPALENHSRLEALITKLAQ